MGLTSGSGYCMQTVVAVFTQRCACGLLGMHALLCPLGWPSWWCVLWVVSGSHHQFVGKAPTVCVCALIRQQYHSIIGTSTCNCGVCAVVWCGVTYHVYTTSRVDHCSPDLFSAPCWRGAASHSSAGLTGRSLGQHQDWAACRRGSHTHPHPSCTLWYHS